MYSCELGGRGLLEFVAVRFASTQNISARMSWADAGSEFQIVLNSGGQPRLAAKTPKRQSGAIWGECASENEGCRFLRNRCIVVP